MVKMKEGIRYELQLGVGRRFKNWRPVTSFSMSDGWNEFRIVKKR